MTDTLGKKIDRLRACVDRLDVRVTGMASRVASQVPRPQSTFDGYRVLLRFPAGEDASGDVVVLSRKSVDMATIEALGAFVDITRNAWRVAERKRNGDTGQPPEGAAT